LAKGLQSQWTPLLVAALVFLRESVLQPLGR
jgi:hypothetical protein